MAFLYSPYARTIEICDVPCNVESVTSGRDVCTNKLPCNPHQKVLILRFMYRPDIPDDKAIAKNL